jgi:hypothetical protein
MNRLSVLAILIVVGLLSNVAGIGYLLVNIRRARRWCGLITSQMGPSPR